MSWFSNLFNIAKRRLWEFLKKLIKAELELIIAELKDFAVTMVKGLNASDLTNEQKRKEAFNAIKAEAIKRGKTIKDSQINLLIELALQAIKQGVA